MSGDSKLNLLAFAIVKSYSKLMFRNKKGSFMETIGTNLHIALNVYTFKPTIISYGFS